MITVIHHDLGLITMEPTRHRDDRGYFSELFKASEWRTLALPTNFVQDNFSVSHKGVIRGLHFQTGSAAQGKIVLVLEGRIWDVAVDIRPDSATRGQWFGMELSSRTGTMLWIPPGFAHGFVCLSTRASVLYKCTAEYDPSAERGLRWNDPDVGIRWPVSNGVLSSKDARLPLLRDLP